MSGENDEYVYDEATGEWRPASEMTAAANTEVVVRDSAGNVLAECVQADRLKLHASWFT